MDQGLSDYRPFCNQCGDDFEKVPDNTVIGNAENRGVGVLVDGDDDPGTAHAGQMLDGAADAAGDVEVWGDSFAGLPDLKGIVTITGVASPARRSDCAAEQRCELSEQGKAGGTFHAAPAGDDDPRLCEVDCAGSPTYD